MWTAGRASILHAPLGALSALVALASPAVAAPLPALSPPPALAAALMAALGLITVALTAGIAARVVRWRSRRRNRRHLRDRLSQIADTPIALGGAAFVAVDAEQGRLHALTSDLVTIGSDPDCTVHIDEQGVAPCHALIQQFSPGRFRLIDASGINTRGSLLNGRATHKAVLANGDRIRLGAARLTFVIEPRRTGDWRRMPPTWR